MEKQMSYSINTGNPAPKPTPVLLLREPVVFPYSLTPVLIESDCNKDALKLAMQQDRLVTVFYEVPDRRDLEDLEFPCRFATMHLQENDWVTNGVAARVVKVLNFPDGNTRILLRGLHRVHCTEVYLHQGVLCGKTNKITVADPESIGVEAARKAAVTLFTELASMQPGIPEELRVAACNPSPAERLADLLIDNLNFDYVEKLLVLSTVSLADRFQLLLTLLNREVEVHRLGAKIQNEVQQSMSQSQREYFLREQLRTIKQELGEDFRNPDMAEIEQKAASKDLPEAVEAVVHKELSRLEIIPQAAPEYHIAYNYLNWMLDVPWAEETEDTFDVEKAQQILDADHYGLKEVKERILEFIAVLQMNPERRAPILCLVGPPGVGKTSLGRSIARALNRNFIRASLGGVKDEAEIRGHRRTYVGALPGRIIQGMKKAGSINPVFLLDEIDKLASDVRGDPASALLEVLDPEQHNAFNDHYLELDYDLSKVFFLTTANVLENIPGPLRDRMEIIELSGYTGVEKREIARRYLVPRQLMECGIPDGKVRFHLSSIDEIINHYTREAGVRQLERVIARLCRRITRKLVDGTYPEDAPVIVNAKLARELLGPRLFLMDEAEKTPQVGCATGMAWTGVGGTILPVEVISIPGKGELKLTGSLGKVMQESAEAAFSFSRANAEKFGIPRERFEQSNYHIHVPDGATPKDGPSAGITLATALLSHLTGKPVQPRLSMTGEITLRGKITAVGGIREKVIAAQRAG
ncbi:MAG: endopeptidase La, partial [Lentisphaeria bacterium]|nr:endopeptidase La [Lentisphaeria bacterium]